MPVEIMYIAHLHKVIRLFFDICIPSYNAPTKMVGAYQYIQNWSELYEIQHKIGKVAL